MILPAPGSSGHRAAGTLGRLAAFGSRPVSAIVLVGVWLWPMLTLKLRLLDRAC
jgi:hypothetical protein